MPPPAGREQPGHRGHHRWSVRGRDHSVAPGLVGPPVKVPGRREWIDATKADVESFAVPPRVLQDVAEDVAHVPGRPHRLRVIAVAEDAPVPLDSPVQSARCADGEPLDPARKGLGRVRLAHEVNVVALDREVDDAKPVLLARAEERSSQTVDDLESAQPPDSRRQSKRDVNRRDRAQSRPGPVRNARPWLLGAPRAGALAAPRPRPQLLLHPSPAPPPCAPPSFGPCHKTRIRQICFLGKKKLPQPYDFECQEQGWRGQRGAASRRGGPVRGGSRDRGAASRRGGPVRGGSRDRGAASRRGGPVRGGSRDRGAASRRGGQVRGGSRDRGAASRRGGPVRGGSRDRSAASRRGGRCAAARGTGARPLGEGGRCAAARGTGARPLGEAGRGIKEMEGAGRGRRRRCRGWRSRRRRGRGRRPSWTGRTSGRPCSRAAR